MRALGHAAMGDILRTLVFRVAREGFSMLGG